MLVFSLFRYNAATLGWLDRLTCKKHREIAKTGGREGRNAEVLSLRLWFLPWYWRLSGGLCDEGNPSAGRQWTARVWQRVRIGSQILSLDFRCGWKADIHTSITHELARCVILHAVPKGARHVSTKYRCLFLPLSNTTPALSAEAAGAPRPA